MIDSTAIQLRAHDRNTLAQAMAAYESQFGPIVTLPIRCDDKKVPFSISNPEKPKPETRAKAKPCSELLRQLDGKRILANAVKKAKSQEKVKLIREMAARGAKIADMAEAVGIQPGSVHRLIRENGIERGPQTDLSA